jgi:hypothetical protein
MGILRSAMPQNVSIKKVIAIVNALVRLHDYCIDDSDSFKVPLLLERDESYIMNKHDGYVEMIIGREHDTAVPINLLHPGHHYNEVPTRILKAHYSTIEQDKLPRTVVHNFISDGHWKRPRTRKRKSSN